MGKLYKMFRVWLTKRPARTWTVEEWNETRQRAYESFSDFPITREDLLCTKCRRPVADQYHIDHTLSPPRRQVICTNDKCKRVDYRVLGETPHDLIQVYEEIDGANGE